MRQNRSDFAGKLRLNDAILSAYLALLDDSAYGEKFVGLIAARRRQLVCVRLDFDGGNKRLVTPCKTIAPPPAIRKWNHAEKAVIMP